MWFMTFEQIRLFLVAYTQCHGDTLGLSWVMYIMLYCDTQIEAASAVPTRELHGDVAKLAQVPEEL